MEFSTIKYPCFRVSKVGEIWWIDRCHNKKGDSRGSQFVGLWPDVFVPDVGLTPRKNLTGCDTTLGMYSLEKMLWRLYCRNWNIYCKWSIECLFVLYTDICIYVHTVYRYNIYTCMIGISICTQTLSIHVISSHLIPSHLMLYISSHLISSHFIIILSYRHFIWSSFHFTVISLHVMFASFHFISIQLQFIFRFVRSLTHMQIWIRTSRALPQDVFPQQSQDRFIWGDHFKVFGSLLEASHEGSYVSVTKQRLEVSMSTLGHPHWRLPQRQSG